MTRADERRMMALNMKHGWGFTQKEMLRLINDYVKAYKTGNTRRMECIEFRLEDANFHTECGLLADKNFAEVRELVERSDW
jgi:hypothetical protein